MEETHKDLLNDLSLNADYSNDTINQLLTGNSKYLRDLRMNLKTIAKADNLSTKEAYLVAYAVAVNNKNQTLMQAFKTIALKEGATEEEVADAAACASLLSANNVLYRFRHFVEKESYTQMRAGLRMNIMMSPVLGKEFFELVSLVVSAVNGCEQCVKSHEVSVLEAGGKEERIWDAIKIGSIVNSADRVIY